MLYHNRNPLSKNLANWCRKNKSMDLIFLEWSFFSYIPNISTPLVCNNTSEFLAFWIIVYLNDHQQYPQEGHQPPDALVPTKKKVCTHRECLALSSLSFHAHTGGWTSAQTANKSWEKAENLDFCTGVGMQNDSSTVKNILALFLKTKYTSLRKLLKRIDW